MIFMSQKSLMLLCWLMVQKKIICQDVISVFVELLMNKAMFTVLIVGLACII